MYCKMAWAGFHSIAKLGAQIRNTVLADCSVFQADCHREIAVPRIARAEFERGV
jgi:hypothetical protein